MEHVQQLRAIAVGLVFAYHAIGFPSFGFLGVDVFFTISGFIIAMIVFEHPNRLLRPGKFFIKRLLRILKPLSILVSTVLFVSLTLYGTSWLTTSLALTGLLSVFGVSNIYLHFATGDYYAVPIDQNPLVHLWSISAELQFYAAIALMIFFVRKLVDKRFQFRALTVLICVLGSLSLALFLIIPFLALTPYSGLLASYFMPQARFWQFALGFVGYWFINSKMSNILVLSLSALGGIAILASLLIPQSANGAISPLSLPASLISAALLLSGRQININNPLGKSLIWIGDRSYSIYLWHLPIIWATGLVFEEAKLVSIPASIILTTGIAWVSHKFFESGPTSVSFGSIGAALLVPLVAVPLAANLGQTQDNSPLGHSKFMDELSTAFEKCSIELGLEVSCLQNSDEPKVLIIGDSHAEHLLPGLSNAGESVLGIYTSLPPGQGHDTLATAVRIASKNFQFDSLIISAKWEKNEFDFEGFASQLGEKMGADTEIFIAGQTPILPRYPDACFHLSNDSLCRFELSRSSIDSNLQILETAKSLGWEFIDLLKVTCSASNCDMRLSQGTLAFRDRSHLTLSGSDSVATLILEAVVKPRG
jgi:peptidoglycan/LPS O-acetylase OafA/YrhL